MVSPLPNCQGTLQLVHQMGPDPVPIGNGISPISDARCTGRKTAMISGPKPKSWKHGNCNPLTHFALSERIKDHHEVTKLSRSSLHAMSKKTSGWRLALWQEDNVQSGQTQDPSSQTILDNRSTNSTSILQQIIFTDGTQWTKLGMTFACWLGMFERLVRWWMVIAREDRSLRWMGCMVVFAVTQRNRFSLSIDSPAHPSTDRILGHWPRTRIRRVPTTYRNRNASTAANDKHHARRQNTNILSLPLT